MCRFLFLRSFIRNENFPFVYITNSCFVFRFAQMNMWTVYLKEITYLEMDCCSFRSKVSPLDIQMLFDLQSYSKTISFLTINQDDICMILGCTFLRKLSILLYGCCFSVAWHGRIGMVQKRREKKQIKWVNKFILFSFSWIIKMHANNENFEEMWHNNFTKKKKSILTKRFV